MSRKVIVYSFLTAILMGGFQNCSPLKSFNAVTGTSTLASEEAYQGFAKILLDEAARECGWLDSIHESMSTQPDGATYSGAVNMQSFATHISLIENAMGNIHLKGAASTASVSEVKGFEGNLVLCDMSLSKVENVTGNVLVVGGNVVDVINVTGNVIVLGGIIGNVTGGNGLAAYLSSDEKVHVQFMGMPRAN